MSESLEAEIAPEITPEIAEAVESPPDRGMAPQAFGANSGQDAEPPPLHRYFRKCRVEVVARESILPAPYNPRHIDAAAQVKLKNGLKRFGMVEPLIWNRRTGHLVGGHQRLKILDQEAGADHGYSVEVSVVDLTETQEKELNILLNNPGAQGYYDPQKLANLLAQTKDIDAELAGFDLMSLKADLSSMAKLDGLDFSHIFGSDEDPAKNDADEIAAMKASKGEYRAVAGESARDGFYLQLVFGTVAEKEKFCEAIDISPECKVSSGRAAAVALGIDIGWEPPADPARSGEASEASEEPERVDGGMQLQTGEASF